MTGTPVFRSADDTVPATGVAAVTPSDVALLPGGTCRSLYVGSGGDVAIVAADGSTATFTNILGGTYIVVMVQQVMATGTTASSIVAMY